MTTQRIVIEPNPEDGPPPCALTQAVWLGASQTPTDMACPGRGRWLLTVETEGGSLAWSVCHGHAAELVDDRCQELL